MSTNIYDVDREYARTLERALFAPGTLPISWLHSALRTATSSVDPRHEWRGRTDRIREAITLLSEALNLLGDRPGDRAAATRTALTAQRAKLQAGLTAYESLGADLDGPAAIEYIRQIERITQAKRDAEQALEFATERDAVLTLRDDIEFARAQGRALCRALIEMGLTLHCPSEKKLPSAELFAAAREHTEALAARPSKRPGPTDQEAALLAGRDASPAEALLWPCFEPLEPHVLIGLRAERYAARAA